MDTPNSNNLFTRIRNHRLTATFVLLATLSAGILAGSVITRNVSGKEQTIDSSDARPLNIPSPRDLSTGFAKIAKEVGPAVVNINTESLPKESAVKRGQQPRRRVTPTPNGGDDSQQSPGDMQDFFNRFFGGGGNGDPEGDGADGGGGVRQALGSGFIVDPRGYIITNNHVVDKADHIYVKLSTDPDGGPGDHGRPAKVIGVDPETDIAVIKIDTTDPLPVAKLGNSDGSQVGDWVLAIGSPFGLSKTVSAGIVSAKDRSIDEPGPNGGPNQFQKFIQTDAAINPGNSGGPLVDMAGEVIGMNTAIYTQSMGSEGVGFAMPSNILASVYNMLISPDHKVVRGSIGISFQGAQSSAVGRMYGFASGGVFVNEVRPADGPAAKAGIKPGDVIVSIDGKAVKDGDGLVADISSRKVGSTVQLGLLRNGSKQTATVSIADRAKLFADQGNAADNTTGPADVDAGEGKLGITVAAVPSNLASKLSIKGGVAIATVRPGSFADEINLAKGDVIVEINKKPVTDESSYRSIVAGLKAGEDVVFVVRRSGATGITVVGGTLP